jgi:cell wall-associated NlpC family hydrolase
MPRGIFAGWAVRPAAGPLTCVLLLLCLATPAAAQDFPYLRAVISGMRSAPPAPNASVEDIVRDSIVDVARQHIGTPYRLGASSPGRAFDCSGFVLHVMNQFGISLPRTAALQSRVGQEVVRDRSQLRPGDLLTFGRGSRITHVGIYSGNGRYIHASSARGQVTETTLPTSSWWRGVRRVVLAGHDLPIADGS